MKKRVLVIPIYIITIIFSYSSCSGNRYDLSSSDSALESSVSQTKITWSTEDKITETAITKHISPDGRLIIFSDSVGNLYIYDVTGKKIKTISYDALSGAYPEETNCDAIWADNDELIVSAKTGLWHYDIKTDKSERLTDQYIDYKNYSNKVYIGWGSYLDHCGDYILFTAVRDIEDTRKEQLFLTTTAGKEQHIVNNSDSAFFCDKNTIVYLKITPDDKSQSHEIIFRDLSDGTETTLYKNLDTYISDFIITQSRDYIVFIERDESQNGKLCVFNIRGKTLRSYEFDQIADNIRDVHLHQKPVDKEHIIFEASFFNKTANTNFPALLSFNADNSSVTYLKEFEEPSVYQITISDDLKTFTYVKHSEITVETIV